MSLEAGKTDKVLAGNKSATCDLIILEVPLDKAKANAIPTIPITFQ